MKAIDLRLGQTVYEAHPNGVFECKVSYIWLDTEEVSFAYTDGSGIRIASKDELRDNFFKNRKDANFMAKYMLPEKMVQDLLTNDNWIKQLFNSYKKEFSKPYNTAMRKAIKIKTGIDA